MENHHFSWVNPLSMASFNSYLSHYQRVPSCNLAISPWFTHVRSSVAKVRRKKLPSRRMLKRSVPWDTIYPQNGHKTQLEIWIFLQSSPGESHGNPHSNEFIHCLHRAFRQRRPGEANVSLVSCRSRIGSSRPSWIAARAPAPRSSGSRSTGTTLATPLGALSWLKLNGNLYGIYGIQMFIDFFLWVSWDNANDQRNWWFVWDLVWG